MLSCVGKELVDYITEYLTKIRDRRVTPDVQPGYMREMLPENAPLDGENWDSIFQDVEKIIMPGVRPPMTFFRKNSREMRTDLM